MNKRTYINWKEHKEDILNKLLNGATLQEVALEYNVSKQAISLGIKKHYPRVSREDFGAGAKKNKRFEEKLKYIQERYNRDTFYIQDDLLAAQITKFRRKRQNAKGGKWGWSIQMKELEFPSHCPVLGIELDWFAESLQDNSPSFDRLDCTKGYVTGNVMIMSNRANRLKNNGTVEEHRLIADFMEKNNL